MLSLLTYNLWHGLSPKGILRFQEVEPRSRRELRQNIQVELLKELPTDVLFLQEVNPIHKRSQQLAKFLGYQAVFERDNSGIKLGKLGPPYNLDSGLCTLLSSSQHIEWKKAIDLSGEATAWMSEKLSLQLTESRRALFVAAVNDHTGRTLYVNTHFHHGIEMNKLVYDEIKDLREQKMISEGVEAELLERLESADLRRQKEMRRLVEEIEVQKSRFNLIVVGGDFNCTPNSEVLKILTNRGFIRLDDSSTESSYTWDESKNSSNHKISQEHIATLLLDDLSFDSKVVDKLHEMAVNWEKIPRRIDDIYAWSQTGEWQVGKTQVFGEEDEKIGLSASDHLGFRVEVNWKPKN